MPNQKMETKKKPRNMFINAIITLIVIPGFLFLLFFGAFKKITLAKEKYFVLNLSLLVIAFMFLLQSIFAIINNNWWIPRMKEKSKNLPKIGIQLIGRKEP